MKNSPKFTAHIIQHILMKQIQHI